MMAVLATGTPLLHFYIWAYLAPILEDDEVLIFHAPLPHFNKTSLPTWHDTHPAIAMPIAKFPFQPPNNCCHEPN